jgi:hypothetical protein
MKKVCLTTATVLFLLFTTIGIHGQNTNANLDQPKLMLQFVGTWQHTVATDTIEVWDCQVYGKSYANNVYLIAKGKKIPVRMESHAYVPAEKNFKGFQIYYEGGCLTWIGNFSSEKKLSVSFMEGFDKNTIMSKYDLTFDTPDNFTLTQFTKDGVKVRDYRFTKKK